MSLYLQTHHPSHTESAEASGETISKLIVSLYPVLLLSLTFSVLILKGLQINHLHVYQRTQPVIICVKNTLQKQKVG